MITKLQIDNFKSLKDIKIGNWGKSPKEIFGLAPPKGDKGFSPFNFIVGPNASGKSNLVEALDFISHAARENLQFAVAEKGGFFNICNRRQRRARGGIRFAISCSFKLDEHGVRDCVAEFDFEFQLQTYNETIRSEYFVDSEKLALRFAGKEQPSFITVTLQREKKGGKDRYALDIDESATGEKSERFKAVKYFCEQLPSLLESAIIPEPQNLILASIFKNFSFFGVASQQLQEIRVFQLNPRIARLPSPPSIHGELGRRGENLAGAIDQMRLKNQKEFTQLIKWIKDIVPTFSNVLTTYTDARQLGLLFEEEGFGSRWFADDVSDGTIMGVALFYALLDKRHKTIIIEEPENTLHPWILKKFLERCREQSSGRQIFITTHSPLVVAEAKPDELYLMERHDGVSSIEKATDREADLSKIINEDFLDLGQYWLSGGIGAVPDVQTVEEADLFGQISKSKTK